jgi:hypothetical protein
MAKIVDPDSLNQTVEVTIDTTSKLIGLQTAGNLNNSSPGASSGVTLQALYSFLKEEWLTDSTLNKFKFPIKMFTKTDGQFQNGWRLSGSTSWRYIRDGGWTDVDGLQYAGAITLGSFQSNTHQGYYQQTSGFSAATSNFDKTGNVNEAILIKSGSTDYTGYLKAYLRISGSLFSEYNLLSEQGITALEPVLYRLPLANSTDLKFNVDDGQVDSNAPYTGMTISYLKGSGFSTWLPETVYSAGAVVRTPSVSGSRWFFTAAGGTSHGNPSNLGGGSDTGVTWESFAGERQIGTSYYAFNRIISGSNGTARQIYNWAERQLRRTSNINWNGLGASNQNGFGTVNGNVAKLLLEYVGDTLKTQGGVFIENFDINDQNSIVFRDITLDGGGLTTEYVPVTTTERNYPFIAAGNLVFSTNLVNETDANTKYTMYFTTNPGGNFDTTSAVVVKDKDGIDITGQITAGTIAWTFDYDNNVQGGRTAGTDAAVTVVAQGLGGAEWVLATYTITRTTGQTVTVNANDERNYSNP